MAVDPHDPISVQSGGTWSTEAQIAYEKEQGIGSWGNRPEEAYESDGSGFVALVKLVFIGFVISGLSGVVQSLSSVDWGGRKSSPPPPPVRPAINYLDLMLPADGLKATRTLRLQAARTAVTIDNRSQSGFAVYRFRHQAESGNPGPMVREATVDAGSKLDIVCHVNQVFTIVRDDGGMLGYVAADKAPGTLQVW
ncbi:MAG: hypothetical protein ACYTGL_27765 [Planctomycetota bacterium]|jgi:hypothetical protein